MGQTSSNGPQLHKAFPFEKSQSQMDGVTFQLTEVLRQIVSSYATRGYSAGQPSQLFYVENARDQVYSVIAPYNRKYERADLVLMARIVNDQIVIEADKTSKPLYDELRHAGIDESQIVVAWKPSPHTASTA
jgi:hypothetical protein